MFGRSRSFACQHLCLSSLQCKNNNLKNKRVPIFSPSVLCYKNTEQELQISVVKKDSLKVFRSNAEIIADVVLYF